MGARGSPEEGSNSAWKARAGFLEVVMAVRLTGELARREKWQESAFQMGG